MVGQPGQIEHAQFMQSLEEEGKQHFRQAVEIMDGANANTTLAVARAHAHAQIAQAAWVGAQLLQQQRVSRRG